MCKLHSASACYCQSKRRSRIHKLLPANKADHLYRMWLEASCRSNDVACTLGHKLGLRAPQLLATTKLTCMLSPDMLHNFSELV